MDVSLWQRLRSGLLKSMVTLMTGTVIAQLISVGSTPLLSRLFSPADFGVLGLVNGAATVVVGVAALRYDMAVVLPKRDGEAANLVWLGGAIVIGVTAVCFVLVGLFGTAISSLLGSPRLASWLWAAPPIVLVTGLYNVLVNWSTRKKSFRRLSISAVIASGSSATSKLSAGFVGLGAAGLVAGQLLGQAMALLVLGAQVMRDDGRWLRRTASRSVALRLARKYSEFPKYHAPMSLAFTTSYNMPLYIVGAFFTELEVGYWSLTVLILSTPVYLVGNAARQVLFQRLSALLNDGEPVAPLILTSTLSLTALAVVPAVVGWFLAPWGVETLLGPEWAPAGYHARHLISWQVSVLATMPCSAAFPALRLQRIVLPWQLIAIAAGAAALAVGGWSGDPLATTQAYGLVMTAMNAIFVGAVYLLAVRADRGRDADT